MKISRSKLIAIITGLISVVICIVYLLLITVLDFRSFLNNEINSLYQDIAVISLDLDNFPLFLFHQ